MQYYAYRDHRLDGGPVLWGLVGEVIGWDAWDRYADDAQQVRLPPCSHMYA